MKIHPNKLTGYVIVGHVVLGPAGEPRPAFVAKRPWPELPLGTDPKHARAEDARRYLITLDVVDGEVQLLVEEIPPNLLRTT